MSKFSLILAFFVFEGFCLGLKAQGIVTGNVESTFQYLNEDSLIGATQPAEKGLLNSYMNVFYTNDKFKAGMRMESYLPRIQGYPNRFDGTGLGMRYVGYEDDFISVTLGSIYEQFGSGLSLRTYEDRALGYDNFLDGARIKLQPMPGILIKGVYGKQRFSFQEGKIIHGNGIVRGIDGEIDFNATMKKFENHPLKIMVGLSLVSKYQKDDDANLILPENVGSYGGRMTMNYKNYHFDAEYIQKEQDPSADNGKIYNYGHAAVFNFGYTQKGLGLNFSGKSVDNMSYRSDRNKDLQDLFINFLPALNKTHTYNLVATLYPYATQPLGEVAYQGEILYTFKRKTMLGGKYGTSVNLNISTTYRPQQFTDNIDLTDSSRVTYQSYPFLMSDSLYWRDINLNITKKVNKKLSLIFSYYNINVNNDVAKISNDASGIIRSHIAVLEGSYKIAKKHAFRAELQSLTVEKKEGKINDKGNWATIVCEYTISPHWSFGFMDQYNYGNPKKELRVHYPILTFGYVRESTRLMMYYGRQRAGLFCVGGVCRFVPASNGLTFSFTHSF